MKDKYGRTPLFYSSICSLDGSPSIAEALQRAGASPNERDQYGRTLWHYWAAKCDVQSIQFALDCYEQLVCMFYSPSSPLKLIFSFKKFDQGEIKKLVGERDKTGGNLLHFACLSPTLDMCDLKEIVYLTKKRASLSVCSNNENHPAYLLTLCILFLD